jgi:2-keto-3-deoxy-L-fuconate dehydrogenase
MGRLAGKKALVTAAGNGIGKAIAQAFAAEGAEVIAADIRNLEWIAAESAGNLTAEILDVRDTAAIAELRDRLRRVDILVNAVGYVHNGTILETSEDDWDRSFDLNVKSMHRTISAFLPAMLEAGGGSIVNIASSVSSIRAAPNRYVYAASKAAIIGLTKAVAIDFIRRGIRCNAICPGTIDSPSLAERMAASASQTGQSLEAVRQAFVDRQPLGRLGTPEEVAALAVYLASDEAAFTTGQTHLVDGGFTL